MDEARSLRSALTRLNRRLRSQGETGGIGLTGLALLGRLYERGVSSVTELASLERLQPQSLTRALRVLEEKRLISRVADDADRRRSQLTITTAGNNLFQVAMTDRESWLEEAMAELSPLEREILRIAIPVLDRLAEVDLYE